jgi:protein-disulfide isomerase
MGIGFCATCGAPQQAGARFCVACGRYLGASLSAEIGPGREGQVHQTPDQVPAEGAPGAAYAPPGTAMPQGWPPSYQAGPGAWSTPGSVPPGAWGPYPYPGAMPAGRSSAMPLVVVGVLVLAVVLILGPILFLVAVKTETDTGWASPTPSYAGWAPPAPTRTGAGTPGVSSKPTANQEGLVEPSFSFPPDQAHGATLGSATAPVTVNIWSDEQCPACADFWEFMPQSFVDEYLRSGKARIVFKDYPVVDTYATGGNESTLAAIGARAADRQGKFWQFIAYLLANQHGENSGWVTQANLDRIARALDLDVGQFEQDCADSTLAQAVAASMPAAEALGINAAPEAMIEGHISVIGAHSLTWADIAAAIDAAS